MIPLTRSMVQGMRSAAMNFAKSLSKEVAISQIAWKVNVGRNEHTGLRNQQ